MLKTEYDAARVLFNRFHSAISFKPTIATVLSPDAIEKEAEAGGALDQYELEGPDRAELLQNLGEFQLATVFTLPILDVLCIVLVSLQIHTVRPAVANDRRS